MQTPAPKVFDMQPAVDEACSALLELTEVALSVEVSGSGLYASILRKLNVPSRTQRDAAGKRELPVETRNILTFYHQLVSLKILMELLEEIGREGKSAVAEVMTDFATGKDLRPWDMNQPRNRKEDLRRALLRGLFNAVSVGGESVGLGMTAFRCQDDQPPPLPPMRGL